MDTILQRTRVHSAVSGVVSVRLRLRGRWKQQLELRMTLAQRDLVQKALRSDVPAQRQRGKIKLEKRLLFTQIDLSEEATLNTIKLIKIHRSGMVHCQRTAFQQC